MHRIRGHALVTRVVVIEMGGGEDNNKVQEQEQGAGSREQDLDPDPDPDPELDGLDSADPAIRCRSADPTPTPDAFFDGVGLPAGESCTATLS